MPGGRQKKAGEVMTLTLLIFFLKVFCMHFWIMVFSLEFQQN
jgi:hypothetical protein